MPRRVPDIQTTLCPTCQHRVVYAATADGRRIALDVGARAYHLLLTADNVHYRAEASSAYPVHLCPGKEPPVCPA